MNAANLAVMGVADTVIALVRGGGGGGGGGRRGRLRGIRGTSGPPKDIGIKS